MMSKASVLITGATGFVGSHLTALLAARGARVSAICRPSSSRLRTRLLGVDGDIRWLDADLSDPASVRTAVASAKAEVVFHLAAQGVRAWQTDPDAVMKVNVFGGNALAEASVAVGVRRVVWMGSGFEYGAGGDAPIDEASPLQPANWYAATKLAAWELARYHLRCAQSPVELVTARLFSAYGPAEHPQRLVPYVITQGLSGRTVELSSGTQRRDYLHARDVAEALALLGEAPGIAGRTFNIGSNEGASVRDVASCISSLLPRPAELRFGAIVPKRSEPASMIADTTQLRLLGWSPKLNLRDGLRQTIEWYDTHRDAWGELS